MKKYLLLLFCLLVLRLQAAPVEATEPVGQRFGMSLIEVLDSIHDEGIYQYLGSSGKPKTPEASLHVRFRDSSGDRLLSYSFVRDRCSLAILTLPLAELDAIVKMYDGKFSSLGKQMWRTPYGRIKVSVAIGAESMRSDHKPHLLVIFDPSL